MQELGSLKGLRYFYSMALEAFDFLAPLLERLFGRFGDAGSPVSPEHMCPCACHTACAEPWCSTCQRTICLIACLGAFWWQGARVLAGMSDDRAIIRHSLTALQLKPANPRGVCCAVSWLLVRLIGRSLGLIYRGVRESLVPRQRPPLPKRRNHPQWNPS